LHVTMKHVKHGLDLPKHKVGYRCTSSYMGVLRNRSVVYKVLGTWVDMPVCVKRNTLGNERYGMPMEVAHPSGSLVSLVPA